MIAWTILIVSVPVTRWVVPVVVRSCLMFGEHVARVGEGVWIIVDTFKHLILEISANGSKLARVCRFDEDNSEKLFLHEVEGLLTGEGRVVGLLEINHLLTWCDGSIGERHSLSCAFDALREGVELFIITLPDRVQGTDGTVQGMTHVC